MTASAPLVALWLVAAQAAGAAPVPSAPSPAAQRAVASTEITLDHAVAALETEGDQAPRFVLRSDYVLMLRTELLMRHAPDALHVEVDPVNVAAPFLEQLIAEVLVLREAERAALGDADPDDVAGYRAEVLSRIGGDDGLVALLRETGTSAAEFDTLIRRRAVAERYLRLRHTRLIEPGDDELRARFESDRRERPEVTPERFSAARPLLLRRMVREALPRALRQYLRSLGSRVRIRRLQPAVVPS